MAYSVRITTKGFTPLTVEANERDTILEVALLHQLGLKWTCQTARCARCTVRIHSGYEHLSVPVPNEYRKLGKDKVDVEHIRFACTTEILGPCDVEQT